MTAKTPTTKDNDDLFSQVDEAIKYLARLFPGKNGGVDENIKKALIVRLLNKGK